MNYLKRRTKRACISLTLAMSILVTLGVGCSSDTNTKDVSKETQKESTVSDKKVITDSAGREVEIPKKVERVYSATPIGNVAIYTINPKKLVAKSFDLSEMEKKYTLESYQKLPSIGKFMMGDTGSEEELINTNPDVVIFMGMINEQLLNSVKKIEEKLKIPVVIVDGELKNSEKAYKLLGELLGGKRRQVCLPNIAKIL